MRSYNIKRLLLDKAAARLMLLLTVIFGSIIFIIFLSLFKKSWPIISIKSLQSLIFSSNWHPLNGNFGIFSFIIGTFYVTAIAVIISVPVCILASIYLSEYAHNKVKKWTGSLIDLLAGIPSVVYGIWGVLVIVPIIKKYIAPFFNQYSTGYSVLAGGIVLAIMIFPIIVQICVQVFKSVPNEVKEVSLSLGATKWQTIKFVVLRNAGPGIIASIILGLSRALGETMAVLMVVGNTVKIPKNIFSAGYPLTALIANNYGEMLSVPFYDSLIMFAVLILLLVILFFNILARLVLIIICRRTNVKI